MTIPDEGQNNDDFLQRSIQLIIIYFLFYFSFYIHTFWTIDSIVLLLFRIKIDDAEMGCSILSPSTSHNVLDSKYKLLVENANENKQVELVNNVYTYKDSHKF